MKTPLTYLISVMALSAYGQIGEIEMGLNYIFSIPQGNMKEYMKQAHGANLDFYYSPFSKRYSLGMELSVNTYGVDKSTQTYNFGDGTSAPMDIVVSNNFYNIMLAGRHFFSDGKIQPFVNAKVGYSIYATSLNVYDPDLFDDCAPYDTELLKRDGTMIFSAGGGIRWEMLPRRVPGRFFLNLSANYTSGGNVNYMNVDAPAHSHTGHTSDVYAKFINTQTQVVHEHHVGNVYTSLVEMLDFRFGVTMKINPSNP